MIKVKTLKNISEILKSKKTKEEKKEDKKEAKQIMKIVLFPMFLFLGCSLAVVKLHNTSWTEKVDSTLNYYTQENSKSILDYNLKIMEDSKVEAREIVERFFGSHAAQNNDSDGISRDDRIDNMNRISLTYNLYKQIYLYKASVFNQKESFLYFNEINYDYFIMKVIDSSEKPTIVLKEQEAEFNKFKEEVLAKTPIQYQEYVDGYLKESKKIRDKDLVISQNKFILGELLNSMYFDKEIDVKKIQEIEFLNSRVFVNDIQNYLNELINTNKELEGFNVKTNEVRGVLSYNNLPKESELENLKKE